MVKKNEEQKLKFRIRQDVLKDQLHFRSRLGKCVVQSDVNLLQKAYKGICEQEQ